ncbi:hypothetical protein P1J78_16615 [Psychromarinibacter sp. C21-152]|uniref:DUF3592 domain-containing protein n=1 Tax=Psychromarinibacter sediminicola TaxID=3033385 RepID=A0AAE3TA08_9RHOB|nr:hypothetical protein [Psychromarinibacter sediminicola]MDF0602363.1 hypothetical protein [Psychromarinibacter sediminicola]
MRHTQLFFWREHPDGRREVSWRTWVLIWLLPVLFLGAAVLMLAWEGYRHLATVPAQGEVVRVYAWEGDTIFDRGMANYGPVFRYTWSDGQETEASVGMSHPDWNFEIGSVREIRYFPDRKTNVVLPGAVNFYAGLIIGGIGLVLLLPALLATWRLRRWQGAAA